MSRRGYFGQKLDAQGQQTEQPEPWDPERCATRLKAGVAVPIEGRDVWVSAWLYVVDGHTGGQVPVILLGIAGFRMLRALGFDVRKYHMNEGHSALLSLELMRRFAYPRESCVRASQASIFRAYATCAYSRRTRPSRPVTASFPTTW